MAAKTIFGYCTIMLIYANQQENDGVDLIFFASKEAYPIVRQLEKITVKKAQAKVQGVQECSIPVFQKNI